jgi:hypothetical protein
LEIKNSALLEQVRQLEASVKDLQAEVNAKESDFGKIKQNTKAQS